MCRVSGVLCTVTAAIVIAAYGHPLFGNHAAMHRIWHTLEFLGNTVIFLLAGALVGESFFSQITQPHVYFLYLLLLWVFLVAMRGVMLVLFWPIITRLEVRSIESCSCSCS